MTLVGYKKQSFKGKDGTQVSGTTLYLLEDERPDVEGNATDKVFVTDRKLGDYTPSLGDDLLVVYNRYGKVASVVLNQPKQEAREGQAFFV